VGKKLKTELSKVLDKSLCKEIFSETNFKIRKYKKIYQNNPTKFSWISEVQFISDLILLSIFYRRVIVPMSETINFYHLINGDSELNSDRLETQENRQFNRKKIVIGAKKIGSSYEDLELEVNIDELQKIVDDFDIVLKKLNIPSKIFLYKSVDEFLENLNRSLVF
jgi:hypothetical protein